MPSASGIAVRSHPPATRQPATTGCRTRLRVGRQQLRGIWGPKPVTNAHKLNPTNRGATMAEAVVRAHTVDAMTDGNPPDSPPSGACQSCWRENGTAGSATSTCVHRRRHRAIMRSHKFGAICSTPTAGDNRHRVVLLPLESCVLTRWAVACWLPTCVQYSQLARADCEASSEVQEQTPEPEEIRLRSVSRVLDILFSDGSHFELPFEYLRVFSPSAEVRGHSVGEPLLVLGKSKVTIDRIEPVGNYAVRLFFGDGHNTGIYTWTQLYRLGRGYETNWGRYLERMEQAGGCR